MSEANKPVAVFRDGNLKAAIFQNEGEKGTFFSTTLSRTYTDERGNFHESNVFTGSDLLRVAELSRKAYSKSRDLHQELGKTGDLLNEQEERGGRASKAFDRQQGRSRRDLRR
ncbi:MAG: hypothetical protein RLN72_01425 [Henriciella sp.]